MIEEAPHLRSHTYYSRGIAYVLRGRALVLGALERMVRHAFGAAMGRAQHRMPEEWYEWDMFRAE
jgi:hypothetical protein